MQNMPRTTQISIKSPSVALQVPRGRSPHGGDPTESPEEVDFTFQQAIWSTFWVGGQNPSLDCSSPAPGCFRGRIVREWAQVAEKCARVNTLRRKKCETFLPSTNKQGGRTIHSTFFVFKARKKGRAHDTFDKLSLQVPQGGSLNGGDPTESPKEVDFTIQTGLLDHSLSGRSKPKLRLLLAASGGVLCESGHKSRKRVRE